MPRRSSANGYLEEASADHPIRPVILDDFVARVRAHGNVVIGRRTAEMMAAQGGASALAGAAPAIIVLSRQQPGLPGTHDADTPERALELLAAGRSADLELVTTKALGYEVVQLHHRCSRS